MMKRWIWVAIAAGLACAACKKDEKKSDTKAAGSGAVSNPMGGGPAEAPAPSAQLGAPLAGAQGLDRMLATVPVESEIVFGLDFDRLRSSALVGGFMDQLTQMNNKNMGFDMKAECGIDASKLATTAVFGMKMPNENDVQIAGVIAGVPKAQMVPCFQKAKAKMEKQGAKVTLDGNYTFLTSEQNGKKSYAGMTFLDDNTMIMKAGMNPVDKAGLDKMMTAKVGDGLTGSTEFMGMVKATNTKATIWALVNGQASMLQKAPVKFKSAFGSIDITDGVVADGRLRMNSPQEATKLAQTIATSAMGQIKGMGLAETAEATADGNDVKVKVTMKKEHVDKLKQMMGGMLSGMMGGMRGAGGGGMGGGPTGP